MSTPPLRRITLVLDRWGLSSTPGDKVQDFSTEVQAFRRIELILRQSTTAATVQNATFIVDPSCWEHFRTYRSMAGVEVREITPRGELRRVCRAEPPNWISNDDVSRWGLLRRNLPAEFNSAAWEASIAMWLIPGLADIGNLSDWFRSMSNVKQFPNPFKCEPVSAWIGARFAAAASKQISSRDIVDELLSVLNASSSPVEFALEWIERVALLPLLDPSIDNPLRSSLIGKSSARQRVLARYLPLVFPLPDLIHSRVSEQFQLAVRQARLKEPESFEPSVLHLNAVWDGLIDELGAWTDLTPQAMTVQAASHISGLPGFERFPNAARLVDDLSPPDPMPTWTGLNIDFDRWAFAYAHWLRRMFLRRELPNAESDPAAGFAKWLKQNIDVCFNHPERSYLNVGKTVREALRTNRAVVLVLVDALACQVSADLVEHLTDQVGRPPNINSFLFAPIPTVSEVAKAAVITGSFPDSGNTVSTESIAQAYDLSTSAVLLTSNWTDAERVQVSSATRLLVYRDNRLDDQLSSASTFKGLLQDATNIFPRIARLLARWVNDLRSLSGAPPLLIITADHGFTFGPPPGQETASNQKLDGSHRCAPVAGQVDADDSSDPTVTFLDAKRLHLKSNYIAARGRYFGRGTISGWRLSHGGLLPEEVLIPHVEWFGSEAPVEWPTIQFPGGVRRERGLWAMSIDILNDTTTTINGGSIHLRIVGHDARISKDVPKLPPRARVSHELVLAGPDQEGVKELSIDVLFRQRAAGGEIELDRCYHVTKQRQLIERTAEQDEFEGMF